MWKKTGLQLLKEFWLPALGAAGWTASVTWGAPSAEGIISNFSTSFFLAAWATSQFFRVRKQAGVESSFQALEERISALVDHLEQQARDIVGFATGGDSYCWIMTTLDGTTNDHLMFMAMHVGEYTLEDINIRIADIDALQDGTIDFSRDRFFKIDRLLPGTNQILGNYPLNGALTKKLNIFMYSKNGQVVQNVRLAKIGNGWSMAVRISRGSEVLQEYVPDGFPLGSSPWD
ncbi:hypothetical protein [Metapseudomonas otitidis]|uniref:hypothetical protein n=1 Tax=Metapseudomonas otitidis TaxID=319939 RepID=UPI0013F65119|nr:hypothetical protein [Pseudomonas otitidis]